jgi:predicted nuclease of predicted toxin-antitoxin system
MKFLVPLTSIYLLRNAGYYVFSITEKCSGIEDELVLKIAREKHLIILTFDRDYGELIYKRKLVAPQGVIYFRYQPLNPSEPADHLLRLLRENTILFDNKFTVLERNYLRQRPLIL